LTATWKEISFWIVFDFLPKKYEWYHGVLFFVVINLLTFSYLFPVSYYGSLSLPWIAPPGWVFGVAWPINNIIVIWGNIVALNLAPSLNRTKYLWLQAGSWLIYVLYSWFTFGLQIPFNFFWPIVLYILFTILSIYYGGKLDKRIVLSLLPLLIWLIFAGYLGLYVWFYN
jgi:translocator protein